VEEVSIDLENLQAYNNTLHEEVHVLYDQLHPTVPRKLWQWEPEHQEQLAENLMGSWISMEPLLP
jgi:hypothetical protein